MPFEPPADMTNGLCYETPSDGVVRVHVVREGSAVSHFDCSESDLGFLAWTPPVKGQETANAPYFAAILTPRLISTVPAVEGAARNVQFHQCLRHPQGRLFHQADDFQLLTRAGAHHSAH